jgi:hypothetical protein
VYNHVLSEHISDLIIMRQIMIIHISLVDHTHVCVLMCSVPSEHISDLIIMRQMFDGTKSSKVQCLMQFSLVCLSAR